MENISKTKRAFGLWESKITPDLIAASIGLTDPQWGADGKTLLWREERSGRGMLMAQPMGDAPLEISEELNVRGGVGYGGGDFTVRDGLVVFAAGDGRLYRRTLGAGFSQAITPAYGSAAAPQISADKNWVVFVHTYEGEDVLALVDTKGEIWPEKLAKGADFYMQPAWHPAGNTLAWVEWDHPNMPWDGTRLMLAYLDGTPPRIKSIEQVAGGVDVPILQPVFSPNGRFLSYMQNEGEWDQLVLYDIENDEKRILIENASMLKPAWVQGVVVQAWAPDSESIYYLETKASATILNQVDILSCVINPVELEGYTNLGQPSISAERRVALLSSGPSVSARVISKIDGKSINIHQRSSSEAIPADDLPAPREIQWTATNGDEVYGIYSAPASSKFYADGLPPVIVNIHGGPTSSVTIGYDLEAAFFTSRGYGYLHINYRGSTGYGRKYREALRGKWGDLDVLDAAGGAQALIDQKLGDPNKLVIKGGSAGGYTVLNTLIRYPGLYKAGLCLYGVTNLFTLAMDTHKFEARYTDSLVGPLPEDADKYQAWSPVFHAETIKDPVAIFQGEDDRVVPPSQSEEIVRVLKANRVPHEYHLYPGEGHGFRKAETRRSFYAAVERFLLQYVIYG